MGSPSLSESAARERAAPTHVGAARLRVANGACYEQVAETILTDETVSVGSLDVSA